MDIHNIDLFLLLSHLAANYFKTHDENDNLHFAWNSWCTEIMESGNDFFFPLHCLYDQLDHACHGYERYHLSWERLSMRMLMLKNLMKPSYWPTSIFNLNKSEPLLCYFKSNKKISRDSCRSSFDLREAAGPKKGEERKDIMVSPPFQGSAPPASWNTFTDTGKVNISRCFFSWVSRPPPWWPDDRSRLRSIGGERRRASVGWCGAAAAGVDQSEIEGRGGRQWDTGRQDTTQRRSFAYYWPANAQMALCRSPPHTIRDY